MKRRAGGFPGVRMLALLASLPGCGAEQHPDAAPATDSPDVVLVLIDTLRPDHLSLYGYEQDTSPYLTRVGQEGAVLSEAFSTSSWTAPSTTSVFTGLYPAAHGVTVGFRARRKKNRQEQADDETETLKLGRIPDRLPTLPELFQRAGYRTYGLGANVNLDPRVGFGRGFDRYGYHLNADAAEMSRQLLEWEDEINAPGPTFVYLHYNDVHQPYHGREPWYRPHQNSQRDRISRYDSEIRFLDEHLARLHERFGWDRDTVLCVISDHGEGFREHGMMGHRFTLFREVNRVLMMVRAPDQGVQASKISLNASLVDVLPTLCELAGIPSTASDGTSLVPVLLGQDAADASRDRVLFAHRVHPDKAGPEMWAAMRGPWKVIERNDDPEKLLFHVLNDPAERDNLAAERPKTLARMLEELDEYRARRPVAVDQLEMELTDDLLSTLEELGYVGDGE